MRIAAPILALCAALVACTEAPTSLQTPAAGISPFVVLASPDHHPPPPDDTSYVAFGNDGSTSSIGNARVMINATANNAWVTFESSGDGLLVASPNARLQFRNKGDIKGTGTLTIFGDGSVRTIDLSTSIVNSDKVVINGACFAPAPTGEAVVTEASVGGAPCVSLPFAGRVTNSDGTQPYTGTLVVGVPRRTPPPPDVIGVAG